MSYHNPKTAVIIDKAVKRTTWRGWFIEYRIAVYRNILQGFEVYCN